MDKARSQAFMMKVVGDLAAATTVSLVHIGLRVGLFRALAGAGPQTTAQLEARTGIDPRYLEAWLAGMACAGYLLHDADADTWALPDEHAVFLADPGHEHHLGGLFQGAPALAAMAPRVAEAFETGQGVPFQAYGDAGPMAIEQMNRAVYEARLVRSWLPALPAVVQRLQAGGRALDVGCGTGLVSLLMAQAWPEARFTGLDVDARSIEIARENARRAGVADRVAFVHRSATELQAEGDGWDFVSSFDVVHDLPDPQGVLRRIRHALAPGGTYLMVEPRVADRLQDDLANPFARMLYGVSCLHCVPTSVAQGGPAWGACWGETRARLAAQEAGFSSFEVLPIRSPVQAFYALRA